MSLAVSSGASTLGECPASSISSVRAPGNSA
jgi:hypothetical protein